MDDERMLARLDGGRTVVDPDHLIPIMATPAAASHVRAWTMSQALVAVHEVGHVLGSSLVGLAPLPEPHDGVTALPRVQVDSVPIRGKHGGRTEVADDDTTPGFCHASAILAEAVVALCGQAAEEAVWGRGSDGAASDWCMATVAAMSLLDSALVEGGPLSSPAAYDYSRMPTTLINARGRAIEVELVWARKQARRLMHPERDRILAAARLLFEARRLDPPGVDDLLRSVGIEPAHRDG